MKADQTIGGTALNQFAPAFAVVMTWAIQGQGLTTIFIPNWVRITRETFGLAPVDGPSFWNNLIFKYFYLTTPVAIEEHWNFMEKHHGGMTCSVQENCVCQTLLSSTGSST